MRTGHNEARWSMEQRYRQRMSKRSDRSASLEQLGEIFLLVFRLNGALLRAGDQVAKPAGLTSATWQVLGAIANSAEPPTVPEIALDMGITKQAVLRHIKKFEASGLVQSLPNPLHRRSPKYALSEEGARLYGAVDAPYEAWAGPMAVALGAELDLDDLREALELLTLAVMRSSPNSVGDDGTEGSMR